MSVGPADKDGPVCGKRPREEGSDDLSFDLRFGQAATVQLLLDMCSSLIKEVQLQVVDSPDFRGVHLKTIDSKQVCMVIARVECDVAGSGGSGDSGDSGDSDQDRIFRVKTDALSHCLKSLPSGYVARIYQRRGSDTIHLSSAETFDAGAEELTFELPTLMTSDDNDICDRIQQMEYQYAVKIDCGAIRDFVRLCKNVKAADVTVEIRSPPGGGPRGSVDNPSDCTFALKASGDLVSSLERVFRSSSVTSDGGDDGNGDSALEVVCSEKYSVDYLTHFLRCMDKGEATLQLSPQKPMLLTYSLDMRKSMVCFVLAPKDED
jgi:hypothetical protein